MKENNKEKKDPRKEFIDNVMNQMIDQRQMSSNIPYNPQENNKADEAIVNEFFSDAQLIDLPINVFHVSELKREMLKVLTRIRQDERIKAFEVLHKIFMKTKDPKIMDLLEEAQREILKQSIENHE